MVDERAWLLDAYPGIVDDVLLDHTMKRGVIYATDDYESVDPSFTPDAVMTADVLVGEHRGMISTRAEKTREAQAKRTKVKAEVFTPSWVCNLMNNVADESWFGTREAFNRTSEDDKQWAPVDHPVVFPDEDGKGWRDYIRDYRLEITCGEAPYLVSRYDTTTGEPIDIRNRIGLLDRKLRVVNEHTDNERDWMRWAEEAYKHTLGYEYQGDNLVLARINLLETFRDYMLDRWHREPTEEEMSTIAGIVSWNIWQMDGLKFVPPLQEEPKQSRGESLFAMLQPEDTGGTPSIIMDWDEGKPITFLSLKRERY